MSQRGGTDPFKNLATATALLQGGYYFATGLWPIIHRPSFELITGPKTDWWLVIMVGALACAIGLTLLFSAVYRQLSRSVAFLAIAAAAAFLAVELVFGLQGWISRVYLIDAGFEVVFMAAWLQAVFRGDVL